jgi:hypothetical protein
MRTQAATGNKFSANAAKDPFKKMMELRYCWTWCHHQPRSPPTCSNKQAGHVDAATITDMKAATTSFAASLANAKCGRSRAGAAATMDAGSQ